MIIDWSNSDIDEFRFAGSAMMELIPVDSLYLLWGLNALLDAEKPNLSASEIDQFNEEVNAIIARIIQAS